MNGPQIRIHEGNTNEIVFENCHMYIEGKSLVFPWDRPVTISQCCIEFVPDTPFVVCKKLLVRLKTETPSEFKYTFKYQFLMLRLRLRLLRLKLT